MQRAELYDIIGSGSEKRAMMEQNRHRTDEIMEKIDRYESEGYHYSSISEENLRNAVSVAGRYGRFEPEMFERRFGETHTILSFENGAGDKRTVIVGEDGRLVNAPLGRLRMWDRQAEAMRPSMDYHRLSEAFKERGVDVSPTEAFVMFGNTGSRETHGLGENGADASKDDIDAIADTFIDRIERAIKEFQAIEASRGTEASIWGASPKARYDIRNELNCGMERQAEAISYMLNGYFEGKGELSKEEMRTMLYGYNSSEMDYITKTVISMFRQVMEKEIEKGEYILPQKTAYSFGYDMAEKNMKAFMERYMDPSVKSEQERMDALKEFVSTIHRGKRGLEEKTWHPELLQKALGMLEQDPNQVKPDRLIYDAQQLVNMAVAKSYKEQFPEREKMLEILTDEILTGKYSIRSIMNGIRGTENALANIVHSRDPIGRTDSLLARMAIMNITSALSDMGITDMVKDAGGNITMEAAAEAVKDMTPEEARAAAGEYRRYPEIVCSPSLVNRYDKHSVNIVFGCENGFWHDAGKGKEECIASLRKYEDLPMSITNGKDIVWDMRRMHNEWNEAHMNDKDVKPEDLYRHLWFEYQGWNSLQERFMDVIKEVYGYNGYEISDKMIEDAKQEYESQQKKGLQTLEKATENLAKYWAAGGHNYTEEIMEKTGLSEGELKSMLIDQVCDKIPILEAGDIEVSENSDDRAPETEYTQDIPEVEFIQDHPSLHDDQDTTDDYAEL